MVLDITTLGELEMLLDQLRTHRGDNAYVEVKEARGGLPRNIGSTVCAFANMPEGGTIIFGVSEPDFTVVGVTNPAELSAGLASTAHNAVSPTPAITPRLIDVRGKTVVAARIHPLSVMLKPALFEGNPYLRQADGDYLMPASEQRMLEIAKLTDREAPPYELRSIPDTHIEDLHDGLTAQFVRGMRETVSQVRDESREQILRETSATMNDRLTVAGLYGLGRFPQGPLPSLSVTVAVRRDTERSAARTANLETFHGPVPELFDQTMAWIRRNLETYQVYQPTGDMISVPEIPLIAIREAVANALVHRDLGPETVEAGKAVDIRLEPDKLIVASPGGLKSLTVTQLLSRELTRVEVNQRLYRIARLTNDASGNRIIEGEGGGVQMMLKEMKRAGLPQPKIIDTGVKVTVIFPRVPIDEREIPPTHRHGAGAPLDSEPRALLTIEGARRLSKNASPVIDALLGAASPLTIAELAKRASLSVPATRYALKPLIDHGIVILDGGPGQRASSYRLADRASHR